MRKILIAAVSINGMIAKDDSEFTNWTSKEDKTNFKRLTEKAGVVIFGNNTFKTFGNSPLPNRLNVILTKQKDLVNTFNEKNHIWYTDKEPADIIKILEEEGKYETCFICGGAQIYSLFIKEDQIDEIMLTVEPIIIGNGINLFENYEKNKKLTFLKKIDLNKNSFVLHYKISD